MTRTEARSVAGLAVALRGPEAGPLALCLHGFPDVPSTFDSLGARLAGEGYRVAAPFLPGYAPSPRLPRHDLDSVANAIAAVVDSLSPYRPIALVGHDWGAAVSYVLAAHRPQRVKALVSLAVPHPVAFARTWLASAEQRRFSRYMLEFQLPFAPRVLSLRDYAWVERLWRRWSPGLTPEAAHLARVKRSLAASRGAPLDYYRHNPRPLVPALRRLRRLASAPWVVPTLHLHGADDGCMSPAVVHAAEARMGASLAVEVLDGVGHFLHLERSPDVEARVVDFLRRAEP